MPTLRAITISLIFAGLSASTCFAISNSERPSKGWWGYSIPKQYAEPPRSHSPDSPRLPLSTQACERFFKNKPKCAKYEEVDMVLNLIGDETWEEKVFTWFYEQAAYLEHPWRTGRGGKGFFAKNVKLETLNKWSEMPEVVQRLLASCQVLRNLVIGSHGLNARLYIGNSTKHGQGHIGVIEFFETSGLFCATTSNSKIQFSACKMACVDGYVPDPAHPECLAEPGINYAKRIQVALAYLGREYAYGEGKNALNGIQLLFNTGYGITDIPLRNSLLHFHDNTGLSSSNDQAVVYTIYDDQVRTDTPMAEVKSCVD